MEIFSTDHLDDQQQKFTLNKTPISFKCDQNGIVSSHLCPMTVNP